MNRKRRHHGGFTIVELLVASTVGLLLVIGVIEAFRQITYAVNKGRANVQLSDQLRNVTNLLREDFRGITVQATPNTTAASAMGYFEIIEGVDNDSISSSGGFDTLTGDTDDVIMFTSRRLGEPFSGRVRGTFVASSRLFENITSPNAEIIYWLEPRNTEFLRDGIDNDGNGNTDEPGEGLIAPTQHNGMPLATLRRRALLIRPDLNNNAGILSGVTTGNLVAFLNENDISVHINANGTVSANTLADLTLRKNRVAHLPTNPGNVNRDNNFPHPFTTARLPFQSGIFMGEDVVFDQVIGFDVRVYDPLVKIVADITGSEPLTPGDPGYETRAHTAAIGRGAYVDLGFTARFNYTTNPNLTPAQGAQLGSLLSSRADSRAQLNTAATFVPPLYPAGSGYYTFGN
ncbi:MAG: prepilin-type N-terminal cleavage/methylation domain-containing protein, partial [Pirellulaceae bacterium]|nr:prepilin-type N-terminal cleavage/methylation domain-containing protein [Pirellulaceae bacterium]